MPNDVNPSKVSFPMTQTQMLAVLNGWQVGLLFLQNHLFYSAGRMTEFSDDMAVMRKTGLHVF